MPLIATSGSLAVSKSLDTHVDQPDSWMIEWTTPFVTGSDPTVPPLLTMRGTQLIADFHRWREVIFDMAYGLPTVVFDQFISGVLYPTDPFYCHQSYVNSNNKIFTIGISYTGGPHNLYTIVDSTNATTKYEDYYASTILPETVLADSSDNFWVAYITQTGLDIGKYNAGTKLSAVKFTYTYPSTIDYHSVKMEWTSDGKILIALDGLYLIKYDQDTNTIVWQIYYLTGSGSHLTGLAQDTLGNIYVSCYNVLLKFTSSGASVWRLPMTRIDNIKTDDVGNLYISQFYSTSAPYSIRIYKVDAESVTPSFTWVRSLTPIKSLSNSTSVTNQGAQLYWADNHYYVSGIMTPSAGVIFRFPDSGAIPGTGSYISPSGATVTYTAITPPAFTKTFFVAPAHHSAMAAGTVTTYSASTVTLSSAPLNADSEVIDLT